MIIKNHTIELKDTSASEMARFRQIMLGIWRQQIEDDKNTDEMFKYAKKQNITIKESHKNHDDNTKKPEKAKLKDKASTLKNKKQKVKKEKGRIYSSSGKFIEEIENGNKILVNTKLGLKYLSQLDYSKKGTTYAVTRIITSEAKEMGYTGWFGVKKMDNESTIAHTSPNKTRTIFFNSTQLKKGSSDNFYDMRNTIHHEGDKVDGHRSEKPTGNYKFSHHAAVYLGQTKAKDFYKSSQKNQDQAITGFMLRAIKAKAEGENEIELKDMANDFNIFHNGYYNIDYFFYGQNYSNFTIYNLKTNTSIHFDKDKIYDEIKDKKPED